MDYKQIHRYFLDAGERYLKEKQNGVISKKTYYKKHLIISRLMAQYAIEECNKAYDDYNNLRRMQEKFKRSGVSITTLDMHVGLLNEKWKTLRSLIASLGGMICVGLDGWQCFGATYEDLFNFCCCSEKTISEMTESIKEGHIAFSDLVCVHCPDYKGKGEFIESYEFAPITHAVKEHMCNAMKSACKNRKIRDKIHEKMFETFPELRDSMIIKTTDEFGNEIFTDLDGIPIDFE